MKQLLNIASLTLLLLVCSCHTGQYYSVNAEFDKVEGLYEDARVMAGGLQLGYVKKIELSGNKFNVTICIDKKNKVSDKDVFAIKWADKVGTKFINIEHIEGSDNYLQDGAKVTGIFVDEPIDTTSGIDSLIMKVAKPILDSLGYDVIPKQKI